MLPPPLSPHMPRETVAVVPQDIENLLKNVFSRSGFTDGYYTENLGRDMFGIRTKEDVTAADTAFSALHWLYRGEQAKR